MLKHTNDDAGMYSDFIGNALHRGLGAGPQRLQSFDARWADKDFRSPTVGFLLKPIPDNRAPRVGGILSQARNW